MRRSIRFRLHAFPSLWLGPISLIVLCAAAPADDELAPALEDEEVYEAVAEVEAPPRQSTERALDAVQLGRVPGTAGDPIKAVDILPGVSRSADGEPILRGAAQHESAVFIDGTSVPFLYHFGGLRSVVHPRLIERVELYPGNFSTRYGRATGGIIEATMRDPRRDALHGEVELSLFDSSVMIEGPVGAGLAFAGAARRSNIDFVFDNFVPEGTFDVVVAPLYWDYQGSLAYADETGARLKLSFLGSRDETVLAFANPNANDPTLRGRVGAAIEFHRAQLAYSDDFGDLKQDLQVSVGVQSLSQNVGPNDEAFFDVIDLGARAEWELVSSPEVQLVFGLDTEASVFEGAYRGSAAPSQEGDLDTPNNIQDQIVVDQTRFLLLSPAAYAEARYFPARGLVVIPGVRIDYYHHLGAVTFNPRSSQRFSLDHVWTLKSAVGWFSQPPEYYEAIAGVGNPDIQPYHALHVSAGAEAQVSDELLLDVEGFAKHLTGRVVSTPGSAPPRFINAGQGRVVGLEVGATYDGRSGFRSQLAYTLSRSERQDRDEAWRLFDRDQTHVLSWALGHELGAGWHAGARFRYVTGNPVTSIEGSVYDAGTDLYYPVFGPRNAARDPAFHQLDVRLEKTFRLGASARLGVYLDVQNAYAAENPEGFTYSYDYRTREPTTGSPFFPNLGLRGQL